MGCTRARGLRPLRNQPVAVTVCEPMKTLALVALSTILAGCSAPLPSEHPPLPRQLPGSRPDLRSSSTAGPYAGNCAGRCLAIVAAAAKVAPVSIVPGTRADISNHATGSVCVARSPCVELAASVILVHVVFTTPTREQGSADVVTNPLGAYTGVNPKKDRSRRLAPAEGIRSSCSLVSDIGALLRAAGQKR